MTPSFCFFIGQGHVPAFEQTARLHVVSSKNSFYPACRFWHVSVQDILNAAGTRFA